MKKIKLVSFLLAGLLTSGLSVAATCTAPLGPIADAGTVNGNNCGHNANFNGVATLCGGVSYSNTGTDIYAVNLGAAQNFTFSVTSAAFTPDIALLSGSCQDNSQCVNNTDYSTGNGTATSGTVTGNPGGVYYLVVTDSTATGAQCGAYSLTLSGTLPVKLQDFSIQ